MTLSLPKIKYAQFAMHALCMAAFCTLIAFVLHWSGASDKAVIVAFNMAVLCCLSTLSMTSVRMNHLLLGGVVTLLSVLLGGVMGYYAPQWAHVVLILYGSLAFFLNKTIPKMMLFVSSVAAFLIFMFAMPFDLSHARVFGLYGIVVVILFVGVASLLNRLFLGSAKAAQPEVLVTAHAFMALAVFLALSLGWLVSHLLQPYYPGPHVLWISLTVLFVVQGAFRPTVSIALHRTLINAVGALILVVAFHYFKPMHVWTNDLLFAICLLLAFSFRFTYVSRILFMEFFVLSFVHALSNFQADVIWERAIFTGVGGVLAVLSTYLSYGILLLTKYKDK